MSYLNSLFGRCGQLKLCEIIFLKLLYFFAINSGEAKSQNTKITCRFWSSWKIRGNKPQWGPKWAKIAPESQRDPKDHKNNLFFSPDMKTHWKKKRIFKLTPVGKKWCDYIRHLIAILDFKKVRGLIGTSIAFPRKIFIFILNGSFLPAKTYQ